MPYPYITQADLEARLSVEVVKQILDDDNDGAADATPVDQLCKDASSKVAGYLRGTYDLDAVATNTPHEVKRLALDVAVAYAAQRHAEYVRRDWQSLMEQVDKELKALRKAETRLDVVGSPEPPANVGGTAESGNPDLPDPGPRFTDNWGDF